MRRLLALPVVAAAIALSAPAEAAEICTPTNQVGACVAVIQCTDLCLVDPYAYGYCTHPVPDRYCDVVRFRVGS